MSVPSAKKAKPSDEDFTILVVATLHVRDFSAFKTYSKKPAREICPLLMPADSIPATPSNISGPYYLYFGKAASVAVEQFVCFILSETFKATISKDHPTLGACREDLIEKAQEADSREEILNAIKIARSVHNDNKDKHPDYCVLECSDAGFRDDIMNAVEHIMQKPMGVALACGSLCKQFNVHMESLMSSNADISSFWSVSFGMTIL